MGREVRGIEVINGARDGLGLVRDQMKAIR